MVKETKEFKKLRWKFFITQKAEELAKISCLITLLLLIPYTLGKIYAIVLNIDLFENITVDIFAKFILTWGFGIMGTLLLIVISLLLYSLIIEGMINWLISNWKKADKRARKELKIK